MNAPKCLNSIYCNELLGNYVDQNCQKSTIYEKLKAKLRLQRNYSKLPSMLIILILLSFVYQASSQELVVTLGANVSIPCGQPEDNFTQFFIVWKKGDHTLAMINRGKVLTSEAQIQDSKDIFIPNASKSDMAEYTCSVNTQPSQKFITMLEVYYPPLVEFKPNTEMLNVEKGEKVTIVCNVDSNPASEITWTKDGEEIKSQNVNINFDTLSWTGTGIRSDAAGTYGCLATNGELPHGRKSIKIVVQSRPELEVQSYVNGAPGKELQLTCKFKGLPLVQVSWFQDGKMITSSSEKSLFQEPAESSDVLVSRLVLHKLTDKDLESIFTCTGSNELGNASTNLTIKKIPEIVVITGVSDEIDDGDTNTALINFYALSQAPVYEFKLTLVDAHNMRFIKEIMIAADTNTYNHSKAYKLPGLRSNAEYEVKIRARNQYGWSEPSAGHRFITNSFKEPAMRSAKVSPTSIATSQILRSHSISRTVWAIASLSALSMLVSTSVLH